MAERFCAKNGRQEVPGSILGRACRPNRSEFSAVFCETRLNMGHDKLKSPSTEGTPIIGLDPSSDDRP